MLVESLQRLVGSQNVLTDEADLSRFGSDLHHDSHGLLAVVRPDTTEALQQVVTACTGSGHPVVARGGGVSYTAGYVPQKSGAVLVDTLALDRILEVSLDDGFVTVEAGCTWERLRDRLEPLGVRTSFGGPFSGAFATVGGAISQSAVVWGVGRYGASAETVLSLGVVVADGSILHTGHDATLRPDGSRSVPHFRPYGPDLTGLFLGDCGALGIKATVSLRLVDVPVASLPLTFTFDEDDGIVAAMVELSRRELGTTVVGTDATMARQRIRRAEAERGQLQADEAAAHMLHVVIEGPTRRGADAEAELVTDICARHGGTDAGPAPTRALMDLRFLTMTSSVGPAGERWAPLHTILPRSRAASMWSDLRGLEVTHRDDLERYEVTVGYLLTTASTQAIIIEPALYWPGRRRPVHDLVLTADQRSSFPEHPGDDAADAFVERYRSEMLELFESAGSAHLQIGRTYPYARTREPDSLALLTAAKKHLDPTAMVNPGVLGIAGPE